MERLAVEPIPMTQPQKPRPVFVTSEPVKETNTLMKSFEAILPVFSALAAILAVRLFLLFAIVGAFILAQAALSDQTSHGLSILIAYCSLTILPLVWLDIQSKKRG